MVLDLPTICIKLSSTFSSLSISICHVNLWRDDHSSLRFPFLSMLSTLFSPLQTLSTHLPVARCSLLIHLFGSKLFNNYIFDNYAMDDYVSLLQDLCQVQYLYLFPVFIFLKDGKRPGTSFMKGSPFLKDLFVLILDKNFSLIFTPPQKILFLGITF